jgi:hypothetical protein
VGRGAASWVSTVTLQGKNHVLADAQGHTRQQLAGRSFTDRSNSRPTHRTGAEASRGPLIRAFNRQARVFYASDSAP